MSRLIRICKTQSWCSFFLLSTQIPFVGKLKMKVVSLSWNLVRRLKFVKLIADVHFLCFWPDQIRPIFNGYFQSVNDISPCEIEIELYIECSTTGLWRLLCYYFKSYKYHFCNFCSFCHFFCHVLLNSKC